MKEILPIIILFGLICCSKTKPSTEIKVTDSIKSFDSTTSTPDDYQAAGVYFDFDSDSLLLDKGDLDDLIKSFKSKAKQIQEKEYLGGDCGGKFVRYVLGVDTLTIDKNGCGDYGAGNSQFLCHGDSLKMVRRYKMEWSAQADRIEFNVTEEIFEFTGGSLTIKRRTKKVNGWKDFTFQNTPFDISKTDGHTEEIELKKELTELLDNDILEL